MINSSTYSNYVLLKQQRLESYLETTIGRSIKVLCKSRSRLKKLQQQQKQDINLQSACAKCNLCKSMLLPE